MFKRSLIPVQANCVQVVKNLPDGPTPPANIQLIGDTML